MWEEVWWRRGVGQWRLMPRSAPSPRPLCFFESDGGSAAEVMDLSEMMAAMPPRPKSLFYL
jgi:hypothetical protein